MDSYVDDELYLHLRHRLLEIRYTRLLLAPLPILRHPNPHPSPLVHHCRMVPITLIHGVLAMSASYSIVGWNAGRESSKMPHQRVDIFLLNSIDACFDRLRDSHPACH